MRRTRAVQRASRRRQGDSFGGQSLATVAVVGYTNAVSHPKFLCSTVKEYYMETPIIIWFISASFLQGKSTLVSTLSNTDLYIDDRYLNLLLSKFKYS